MKQILLLAFVMIDVSSRAGLAFDQGQIVTGNRIVAAGIDAPVLLPDGRGAGYWPGMVAQFFLVRGDVLIPLGERTGFRTNSTNPLAFAYTPTGSPVVPGVPPGEPATFRFRVWDEIKGASFEESRESGGYYGESETTVVVGGGVIPPSTLTGLVGFTLTRRETLVVKAADTGETGIVFHLDGGEGKTYSLESSSDLIRWTPLETVKVTGTAEVTLPIQAGSLFVRAVVQN